MFIRILPTTLLQIFRENLLYFQVILKSMKIADDTFLGNSECEWVNHGHGVVTVIAAVDRDILSADSNRSTHKILK